VPDAPVRIEADVWDDWRFQALADELGVDLYSAVGRMARLWGQCTDRQSPILPIGAVRARLGARGVEALCDAADLGERVEGGIRLKGTEGRIEWLGHARAQRQTAGAARATAAQRDAGGRFAAGPAAPAAAGRSASATANDRVSPVNRGDADTSSSGTTVVGPAATSGTPAAHQLSSLFSPSEDLRERERPVDQHKAWAEALRLSRYRAALRLWKSGIGAQGPQPAMMAASPIEAEALRLVQRWVVEARAVGADPEARVAERGAHLIAVLAAQCEARQSLASLRETTCWTLSVADWAETTTPAEQAAPQPERRDRAPARAAIGAARARNDHGTEAKPFGEA
jgi:hypothetical protein